MSVLRDITQRKASEQAKLQIVSTVSHELRTPLTSIIGALRLLISQEDTLPPKIAGLADVAHRNSQRMLLVLNDILDFEKMQAGKMSFDMERLELRGFLSEATSLNKGYGDECGITFVTKLPEEPAYVKADASRLMQVMSNLLSNAAKFSPEGERVFVDLTSVDGFWLVSIIDRGPGIPEEDRDQIFDSFFQSSVSTNTEKKGTGLGLCISKKIVERHEGKIGVISQIGEGTTMYFMLPKVEPVWEVEPEKKKTKAA